MQLKFIIFIGVVGLLSQASAGIVDGFIKNALEKMRPTLDDIYVPYAEISGLVLANLFVDGLEKFNVTTIEAQTIPLAIKNMTIEIGKVAAEGRYRMTDMTLPGPITVSGAGNLRLSVGGVKIYAKATCTGFSGKIKIKEIQDMSVSIRYMEIELGNLGGSEQVSKLLNSILNSVGTDLVNLSLPPLLLANKANITAAINNVLATLM